jgi:hypothetical protein
MIRKRPFNRSIIRGNIAEAIEQLQKLEQKAATGTLNETELQIGLAHAYHHLNFAWNVRRVASSEYARLSQEQFDRWSKYPEEINDI